MPANALNARERLLEVIHILESFSDEGAPLSIHDIHGRFQEGHGVSIRAVREDVAALEESIVFPVTAVQEKNGMPKHYYYDGRPFEIHELRLLMDVISAAKFIPKKETERLLMKIRRLTSRRQADQLKNELVLAESKADHTMSIFETVQYLHEAIHHKRIIAFQYGRYGTDLQFVLSKEGGDYIAHPLGLVWNNDRYYVVAYYPAEQETRQYRLDRMRNVRMLQEHFLPDPYFSMQEYTRTMVHMFAGEMISLEADFSHRLLNMVIDRFGVQANLQDLQDGTFRLKAQVAMSDGLLGWLLRWGGDVKVLHPPQLVGMMKEETEKLYNQYQ